MALLPETLSNLNSDPSRFNDFIAYLSRNHCLETLQFIQDASRYRACYAEIVEDKKVPWEYLRRHYDYLQELWEDLLSTYILPNGDREVNLPSEVRARLLGLRSSALPPHPSELDDIVQIVLELMEYSILPGFLKPYETLDQSRNGVVGGWRGLSTPTSEGDHEDSVPRDSVSREESEATHCTRRRFLASPRSHLLRPLGGLLDHFVCDIRGMRWLKNSLEKYGTADTEVDTKDKEISAKLLE
ncbi:RGS domain [Fusarium oxysporum f. sp. vasinfectum]|nr:RGS domain [Fusarium oxysporum f. sp. vasinfectum]